MFRTLTAGALLSLILMATLAFAPAHAAFVNPGFEAGDFTGWTQTGGTYHTYDQQPVVGLPPYQSAVVAAGNIDVLSKLGVNIPMVKFGNSAARVNSNDNGLYHWSQISQTYTNDTASLDFAWCAVLQDPQHIAANQPYFHLDVLDKTTNTTLYDIRFAPPVGGALTDPWKKAGTGSMAYVYSDWQNVHLDTSAAFGHSLQVDLFSSDCREGAHNGAVYLDGFGVAPVQAPVADVGGPYAGKQGVAITLDGSGSVPGASLPVNPIVSYEWDVNMDGIIDATGVTANFTVPLSWLAGSEYPVGLKVTDSIGLWDWDIGKITVPGVHAVPEASALLTWLGLAGVAVAAYRRRRR